MICLVAAVALPILLVVVRPAADDPARPLFDARLLYWTMPVVCLAAALAWTWRACRAVTTPRDALRAWWPGLLLAIALTAAVFALVPPSMRVQFDETSLVNVSQNMHERRAADMTTGAVPFDREFFRLENTVDKRPPLFAFLVSVVHDVTGQRVANAFAVNALLLATALFLAFAAVRRPLGPVAALAAPLLLLAVPLTTVVATSAGFDLLAAVLLGATVLAARDFVQHPERVRFVTLVATGMLFAQSRYESLLAFAVIAALALWQARGHWRVDRATWLALAAGPALVTPLFFLLQTARNPNFYPEAGGAPLVAMEHGITHVGPFIAATFSPSLSNPLPGVLAIAGAAAWTAWLVRRSTRRDLLVVVPVVVVTATALGWFFGDVRDPVALRLYLASAWFFALSPLLLVAMLGSRVAALLLAAATVLAALRTDEVRTGDAFPKLDGAKLADAVEAATRRADADPKTALWVTVAAQHLATLGVPALSPAAFVRRQRDVEQLLANGHVRAIFVIETPLDAAFAPAFGDPRQLLGAGAGDGERLPGDQPVTVHRLHR